MTDASGVPNLRDELNRKSFDTVEWLIDSARAGKLSEAQFSTGVDAVFMCVNGLVDDQMLEIVTAATDLCGKGPVVEKRIFTRGADALVVQWQVGESSLRWDSFGGAGRRPGQIECDTPAQARVKFKALCDRLLQSGYTEL